MMKIEILGTGCTECRLLDANVAAAADKLGIAYVLERVTEFREVYERGVMLTPALLIDGKVQVMGRVPNEHEISELLNAVRSNDSRAKTT